MGVLKLGQAGCDQRFGLLCVQVGQEIAAQQVSHLCRRGLTVAELPHPRHRRVEGMHLFVLPVVETEFVVERFDVNRLRLLGENHGHPPFGFQQMGVSWYAILASKRQGKKCR